MKDYTQHQKSNMQVSETACWVRELLQKPGDSSVISETLMFEGDSASEGCLPIATLVLWHVCTPQNK